MSRDKTKKYITLSEGLRGFYAVMMWWNPDDGGFWEPWISGVGSFDTEDGAIEEGKAWAEAEDIEFVR